MRVSADPIIKLPFDSELAALHLRLSADDDMNLVAHEVYLKGALEWAESQTHRAFSKRTHRLVLHKFPLRHISLPRGKCESVESIVYYEDASTPVTLRGPSSSIPGSDYQEDLESDAGGLLSPLATESWPGVDSDVIKPIEITFTAGYDLAPADAQVAMFMYAADRYDIATQNDAVRDFSSMIAERLIGPFSLDQYT